MRGPVEPASDIRTDHTPARIPGSTLPRSIGSDLAAGPTQPAPKPTITHVTHSPTTFSSTYPLSTTHHIHKKPHQLTSAVCLLPGLLPHDSRTACVPITVWWSLCSASSAHALKPHHIHPPQLCQRSAHNVHHTQQKRTTTTLQHHTSQIPAPSLHERLRNVNYPRPTRIVHADSGALMTNLPTLLTLHSIILHHSPYL